MSENQTTTQEDDPMLASDPFTGMPLVMGWPGSDTDRAYTDGYKAGFAAASKPHGCVCPPGSEATCKGWQCPRRQHDWKVT